MATSNHSSSIAIERRQGKAGIANAFAPLSALARAGLSGNALKLIAIAAMTIDHLAWLLLPGFQLAALPLGMHVIGRLTAPIMMFFIVEGYYHTRDRRRYLVRLLLFAAIAHVPYTLMFPDFVVIPGIPTTSVIWPFAMGLLALMIDQGDVLARAPRWLRYVLVWCCLIAALPADWSMPAAVAILYMGRARGDFKRQMIWLMVWIGTYAAVYAALFNPAYALLQLCVALAIPLLAAYNGQRGSLGGELGAKAMKWSFYIYYPAHLLVLGLLRLTIGG